MQAGCKRDSLTIPLLIACIVVVNFPATLAPINSDGKPNVIIGFAAPVPAGPDVAIARSTPLYLKSSGTQVRNFVKLQMRLDQCGRKNETYNMNIGPVSASTTTANTVHVTVERIKGKITLNFA
eukprot:SAG11_NODE_99_length_16913_cov_41.552813_7_plen_124_part_00